MGCQGRQNDRSGASHPAPDAERRLLVRRLRGFLGLQVAEAGVVDADDGAQILPRHIEAVENALRRHRRLHALRRRAAVFGVRLIGQIGEVLGVGLLPGRLIFGDIGFGDEERRLGLKARKEKLAQSATPFPTR